MAEGAVVGIGDQQARLALPFVYYGPYEFLHCEVDAVGVLRRHVEEMLAEYQVVPVIQFVFFLHPLLLLG